VRIFVSSDMEGTAGVVDWDQVRPGGEQYGYYTGLLTREVNAAIEGAAEAGATAFLVNDSHGRMANLRPDALAGRASYLSGRYKPRYMMEGLDTSFDAVFFVSYHGSMSAQGSTLSHTYFPAAFGQVTLNGSVTGEAGINSLVALGHGVPVVLITGDATTAAEIQPFCPGLHTAVVKRSVSRFAAESLHPDAAADLIRSEARAAVAGLTDARPPAVSLPATLGILFRTSDYAQLAARITGVVRTGDLTATITDDDPSRLYDTFITVVLLCRGLMECLCRKPGGSGDEEGAPVPVEALTDLGRGEAEGRLVHRVDDAALIHVVVTGAAKQRDAQGHQLGRGLGQVPPQGVGPLHVVDHRGPPEQRGAPGPTDEAPGQGVVGIFTLGQHQPVEEPHGQLEPEAEIGPGHPELLTHRRGQAGQLGRTVLHPFPRQAEAVGRPDPILGLEGDVVGLGHRG
jgi:D-amino peptidase